MPTLLSAQEEASSTGAPAQGSAFADRLFAKLDVDGDGMIDKSEIEAAFTAKGRSPDRLDAVFARLDGDGDGSLSENELATGVRHGHGHTGWRWRFVDRLFSAVDTAGDGTIDKSELEAAFAAVGRGADQADEVFAKLDADGDGSLSRRELVAAILHGRHHHHADGEAVVPSESSATTPDVAPATESAATTEDTAATETSAATEAPSTTEVESADETPAAVVEADATDMTAASAAATDALPADDGNTSVIPDGPIVYPPQMERLIAILMRLANQSSEPGVSLAA